jgi:hypothetical protein
MLETAGSIAICACRRAHGAFRAVVELSGFGDLGIGIAVDRCRRARVLRKEPSGMENEIDLGRANRLGAIRLGLIVAVCAWLASLMPDGLFASTLSSMLAVAALISALLAAIVREPLWPPRMTRWDQASVLLALSMLAGWAADPDAAAEALSRLETSTPSPS